MSLRNYKVLLEKDGKEYVLSMSYFLDKFENLERQIKTLRRTVELLISMMPKDQIVKYLEERIVDVLRDYGKAFRVFDLRERVLEDAYGPFWLLFSDALRNLEKKEVITINRGWIKLR